MDPIQECNDNCSRHITANQAFHGVTSVPMQECIDSFTRSHVADGLAVNSVTSATMQACIDRFTRWNQHGLR